ncbi:MAG: tetratricopeptide repeat protein [Promethearchaeota archaeon]
MSQNHQNAMGWNKKAFEYEKQGNIEEALRCIEEALKIQPRSEFFLLNKATILERAERYQEAIQIYKQHQKDVPQSMNGLIGISRILKKLGRHEEAKPYEEELKIRANPDTSPYTLIIDPRKGPLDAYMSKINTLMGLGRKNDATKFCFDYITKFGDNHWIDTVLANIFLGEGSWKLALEYCDKALNIKSNFYGALLVKGNTYIQKKEPKNAMKCLNILLKQKNVPDKERAEAHSAMGAALIGLRQPKKALKSLDEALKLNPNIGAAWFMKGNALLNLGKISEGMKMLQKTLEVDKSFTPIIDQMLREMKLR